MTFASGNKKCIVIQRCSHCDICEICNNNDQKKNNQNDE